MIINLFKTIHETKIFFLEVIESLIDIWTFNVEDRRKVSCYPFRSIWSKIDDLYFLQKKNLEEVWGKVIKLSRV